MKKNESGSNQWGSMVKISIEPFCSEEIHEFWCNKVLWIILNLNFVNMEWKVINLKLVSQLQCLRVTKFTNEQSRSSQGPVIWKSKISNPII